MFFSLHWWHGLTINKQTPQLAILQNLTKHKSVNLFTLYISIINDYIHSHLPVMGWWLLKKVFKIDTFISYIIIHKMRHVHVFFIICQMIGALILVLIRQTNTFQKLKASLMISLTIGHTCCFSFISYTWYLG